jgi:hypothetical protein
MFNSNNNAGGNQPVVPQGQFGGSNSVFLKWSLVFGIAILLNLFSNYALSLLYKEPNYLVFCAVDEMEKPITDKASCTDRGGKWTPYTGVETNSGQTVYTHPISKEGNVPTKAELYDQTVDQKIVGYCDPYFTCGKEYNDASKVYNRNVFVTLAIFGVLLIIGSFFVVMSPAVSIGLSFGGVLSLIVASLRYWSDMNDYVRVTILGVALIVLIGFALKKVRA